MGKGSEKVNKERTGSKSKKEAEGGVELNTHPASNHTSLLLATSRMADVSEASAQIELVRLTLWEKAVDRVVEFKAEADLPSFLRCFSLLA